MGDVTSLLDAARSGETGADERLWQTVYQELRRMAAEKMSGESRQITLQATALVHEAWLRLSGPGGAARTWDGRGHFFSAAAEAMRRILVDQARRRLSQKRGGDQSQVPLENLAIIAAEDDSRLLHVHETVDALAVENEQQAQIVKLRFFAGLSHKEIAALLQVSEKTVQRQWVLARTWLYQAIRPVPPEGAPGGENSDSG